MTITTRGNDVPPPSGKSDTLKTFPSWCKIHTWLVFMLLFAVGISIMQTPFYRKRKIVYIVSLGVLLIALYFIGRPAQVVIEANGDVRHDYGGLLAQLRVDSKLSESQIGKIDPASSAIKLATFGMRGVAVAMLWHQAMEQQKRHEWNDVVAIANQIIFLEPHFVTIWDFLGWTLAYNASAEFDDYRERYRWVVRGIDFLVTGLEKNRRSTKLYKSTGWTISQKIGIADEVEQYRRLLKDDEAFGLRHNCPLPSDRDNWILGRRWYHQGEELVLRDGMSLGNESDFIYFANSRLNLFNYAKWKRRDGIFGEEAIQAWDDAINEWREFGRMELATAIPADGKFRVDKHNRDSVHRAKLETVDIVREEEKELLAELHAIAPGLKETLCIERWQQLGDRPGQQGSLLPLLQKASELNPKYYPVEELQTIQKWLDMEEPDWQTRLTADRNTMIPADEMEHRDMPAMFLEEADRAALGVTDGEISQMQQRALEMLRLSPRVLSGEIQALDDVPREAKGRARTIVETLDSHKERIRHSDLFRGILNYESRFKEVAVETTHQADEAHRLRYEARKAYYDGRLADARNGWLDAMRKWDELLDIEEFKDRATDGDFVRERIDLAEKFLIILDDSNMIFSDVSDDPVPFRRLMWHRVFQEASDVENTIAALEYVKKEYEQALAETDETKRRESLERAEKYFAIVVDRFIGMNYREKYMEYAPFLDLRDRILEASAYYIRSLESQGKPLPEPLIFRTYVELMLKHDSVVTSANEILLEAMPLIREGKYDEAQTLLDRAVVAWQAILDKYPIIAHDPTNSAYSDVVQLARQYAAVLQAQEKPIPDDFPLRTFLR